MTPVESSDESRSQWAWVLWAMAAAFGGYFCMYGFRKPFTAGAYDDTTVWGVGFKTVLVTVQVAGYMMSKFIGIRVVAELSPQRRAAAMLCLVLLAEAALVLFGLVPRPWNAACLFLNGLSLGMVFGLVMGFLEGRQFTELLAAGLCASFILADGVTKSVGTWLLNLGVTEDWMPCVAGLLFLPPLCLCVWMLTKIAPPSARDVAARSERTTMDRALRKSFVARYAIGLVPIILMYLAVTIVRSIRADFSPEIWRGLGNPASPGMFTSSEMLVAFGVLAINGATVLIKDNRRAFFAALTICALGFALMAVALVARDRHQIDGFAFMVLTGLGLYLPYVATHTTIFERMLGMTRERGNIGFLMYVADSFGYLGYVAVMIVRNFVPVTFDLLGMLTAACWASVGLALCCLFVSWCYFSKLATPAPEPAVPAMPRPVEAIP